MNKSDEPDLVFGPGQLDPAGGAPGSLQEEPAANGLDWVGVFGAGRQEDKMGSERGAPLRKNCPEV